MPKASKKPGVTAFRLTSSGVAIRLSARIVMGSLQLPPVKSGKRATADAWVIGDSRISSSSRRIMRLPVLRRIDRERHQTGGVESGAFRHERVERSNKQSRPYNERQS